MPDIGIYQITNLANGKVYIGQSRHLHRRILEHKSLLRNGKESNKHLQRAYQYYGEDSFSVTVIETCKQEELNNLEIHYISLLNSNDKRFGYNILSGGNVPPSFTGLVHTEETKLKMSRASKGNTRWLGKSHSEETKKKMSKSSIGIRKSNAKYKYIGVTLDKRYGKWKCVIQYNGKPKWIGSFTTELEAAKAYDETAISLYGESTRTNFGVGG